MSYGNVQTPTSMPAALSKECQLMNPWLFSGPLTSNLDDQTGAKPFMYCAPS